MWPRGLKYRSIFYLYPHIYVEAYVASWIEISIGDIKRQKNLVEAYVASWIEI